MRALAWRNAPAVDALTVADLGDLFDLDAQPEFLLVGTGAGLRQPPRAFVRELEGRGIGVEVMDSRAAARASSRCSATSSATRPSCRSSEGFPAPPCAFLFLCLLLGQVPAPLGAGEEEKRYGHGAAQPPIAAEFRSGLLTELPGETGSFDLGVCSLALTHLEDPAPAISELARVVREGGRVVISDVHPFFIALGAQAAYRVGDERAGYVVNFVHWPSMYLNAFRAAGLRVHGCHELLYRREEVELWAGRVTVDTELIADALVGLPAVIVWDLARLNGGNQVSPVGPLLND